MDAKQPHRTNPRHRSFCVLAGMHGIQLAPPCTDDSTHSLRLFSFGNEQTTDIWYRTIQYNTISNTPRSPGRAVFRVPSCRYEYVPIARHLPIMHACRKECRYRIASHRIASVVLFPNRQQNERPPVSYRIASLLVGWLTSAALDRT